MLILSIIYLLYVAYKTIQLIVKHKKATKTNISKIIELVSGFCSAIHLLLLGLSLQNIFDYSHWFNIPLILWILGEVLKRKTQKKKPFNSNL